MKRLSLLLAALLLAANSHAQIILRQSTAYDIQMGPFVDSTDGATAETGLTISQAGVRLKKPSGAWAQKNDSSACEHMENGWYQCALNSTDTNSVGELIVSISEAGALPVWRTFQVVNGNLYAADYASAATAERPTDLTKINGDAGSAAALAAAFNLTPGAVAPFGIARQGTAQSASSTTLVLDSSALFQNDTIIGMTLMACGSAGGYCQSRTVTDYVLSTRTATVDEWTITPGGTITYYLFATAPASGGGGGLDAAGVRAAVGLSSANLDTQLSGIQSDTDNIQTRLPAALVGGRMDASTGAMAANVMTAAATASDYVTEVQTAAAAALTAYDPPTNAEMEARTLTAASYATASALATVDGVVGAILVTTDKLDDTLEDDLGTYRFTANALEQAPSGGGGGDTDWTSDERTAIRAILGVPVSGTTPVDPSAGILDAIRDAVAVVQSDTDDIQARIPAALVDGRVEAHVGAMANDVMTAAAAAPDLTTELQAGLATASSIASLPEDIRDVIVESQGNVSSGCVQAVLLAFAAGDITTVGNSTTWRDPSNGEVRITSTVTSAGNRTASIHCPIH